MLSWPKPVLYSPPNGTNQGCKTNELFYISRDDILYIHSKQVNNSFLLLIELLSLINQIIAFIMNYLREVVDIVDELQ